MEELSLFKLNNNINNIKNIIPTKTSDLTNDSNYVTSNVLATVATSGSYNDLSNKPTSMPANGGTADTLQRNLILESTDLNTIPSTIGIGKLKYTELSGAMTNAPTDYNNASNPWGHLLTTTHSYSTNNWTQLLLGMTFDGMYYRNADNTNWKTILDSSNWSSVIPTATTSANGLMSNSQVTALNNSIKNNIETDDDFNDMYVTGIYAMQDGNHNPANGEYASLLIMHSDNLNDDSYFHQIAAQESTDNIFIRNKGSLDAGFSSWKQFFTTGNCYMSGNEEESRCWFKTPNGFCIQWGAATAIAGQVNTINFEYSFNDEDENIITVLVQRTDGSTVGLALNGSPSAGYFQVMGGSGSDIPFRWVAIGRLA